MGRTGITELQTNGHLRALLENAMPWKPENAHIGEKAFCTILHGNRYVVYLDGDYYFPDRQECDLLEDTILQISKAAAHDQAAAFCCKYQSVVLFSSADAVGISERETFSETVLFSAAAVLSWLLLHLR